MLTVPGATQPAALFIKHPLETSLSLSLLDIIMSSLISNGIFIALPCYSRNPGEGGRCSCPEVPHLIHSDQCPHFNDIAKIGARGCSESTASQLWRF